MTQDGPMRLVVVTPNEVVLDAKASKITAEASNGSFTLLPRHIDFVAPLVPGLLVHTHGDDEQTLAVDGGVLVKQGHDVRVAARAAVAGDGVLELQRAMKTAFRRMSETEHRARSALAHLETDAIRRLIELERHG